MSSRNARGSRGHGSWQPRDLSVTEAEIEALSLWSEQLAISSRRTPSVPGPSPYHLGLFPEASSSTVGGAAVGLGGQLSTSERDWRSTFSSFEKASGRHNMSFLPAGNTSALDFNTSSYPLAAGQEMYHSDSMHSHIRDYSWANTPTFPGPQFPRNMGPPLSRPEGFPLLNPPAGLNPDQSNEKFISPESQLLHPIHLQPASLRYPSRVICLAISRINDRDPRIPSPDHSSSSTTSITMFLSLQTRQRIPRAGEPGTDDRLDETETPMLGPRLQRARVLHFQQPAAPPAGAIRRVRQGGVSALRRRLYAHDGPELARGAGEV
ncbi:hypothetical protein VTN02DRAFT_3782 [Thermoascus thermophilus]